MRQRTPEQIQAMSDFGFDESDFVSQFEVWPENWQVFKLFDRLSTQWRTGFSGPTGLDYLTLFHELERMNLAPLAYDEMFSDIRVMEAAALNEIYSKD